ncbi:MAG: histidine kinase, partial [Solirubrobacteraceae bacterium]
MIAERQRIARDLHDGLAQDLATIALRTQRLQNGSDRPDDVLMLAARRALAISRGTIVDLSASDAPTTEAALRQVADELAARFTVLVDV